MVSTKRPCCTRARLRKVPERGRVRECHVRLRRMPEFRKGGSIFGVQVRWISTRGPGQSRYAKSPWLANGVEVGEGALATAPSSQDKAPQWLMRRLVARRRKGDRSVCHTEGVTGGVGAGVAMALLRESLVMTVSQRLALAAGSRGRLVRSALAGCKRGVLGGVEGLHGGLGQVGQVRGARTRKPRRMAAPGPLQHSFQGRS